MAVPAVREGFEAGIRAEFKLIRAEDVAAAMIMPFAEHLPKAAFELGTTLLLKSLGVFHEAVEAADDDMNQSGEPVAEATADHVELDKAQQR
jgi:hypothetical protein